MGWYRGKFSTILMIFEIAFLVLFIVFVQYGDEAEAKKWKGGENTITKLYPMFQDVHVMMYIGFGFLMTFLKRYGYSAIGINMLIAAFVVQWHILMSGFLHLHHGKILINIESLITAEFAAAAVLISFGAVLGKLSPLQLILMAFLEIIVFAVNEYVGVTFFKVVDMGGSMFVHVFGAYFGLTIARIIYVDDVHRSKKEGSIYHADIFSMLGTVFLWLFWPSFNAALAVGDAQHRAVINSYISLAACAVVTFVFSSMVGGKKSKFDMVHVQNATLAGGVAVGTCADLMIQPWGAVVIGSVAAVVSVIGYKFITPAVNTYLKIHDTCGVNNLHGMPGILGGIAGAVASAVATMDIYGYRLYSVFPARVPIMNSTEFKALSMNISDLEAGEGRTALEQGGYQMAALALTIGMAIVGGIITGFILKIPMCNQPDGDDIFDDSKFWEVAEEGFAHVNYDNEHSDDITNGNALNKQDENTKI